MVALPINVIPFAQHAQHATSPSCCIDMSIRFLSWNFELAFVFFIVPELLRTLIT